MVKERSFAGVIGDAVFAVSREAEEQRSIERLAESRVRQQTAASRLRDGQKVRNIRNGKKGRVVWMESPWRIHVNFKGRTVVCDPSVLDPIK